MWHLGVQRFVGNLKHNIFRIAFTSEVMTGPGLAPHKAQAESKDGWYGCLQGQHEGDWFEVKDQGVTLGIKWPPKRA